MNSQDIIKKVNNCIFKTLSINKVKKLQIRMVDFVFHLVDSFKLPV